MLSQLVTDLTEHIHAARGIMRNGEEGRFHHHFNANQPVADVIMRLAGDAVALSACAALYLMGELRIVCQPRPAGNAVVSARRIIEYDPLPSASFHGCG